MFSQDRAFLKLDRRILSGTELIAQPYLAVILDQRAHSRENRKNSGYDHTLIEYRNNKRRVIDVEDRADSIEELTPRLPLIRTERELFL